jgi:hypothetical protein
LVGLTNPRQLPAQERRSVIIQVIKFGIRKAPFVALHGSAFTSRRLAARRLRSPWLDLPLVGGGAERYSGTYRLGECWTIPPAWAGAAKVLQSVIQTAL